MTHYYIERGISGLSRADFFGSEDELIDMLLDHVSEVEDCDCPHCKGEVDD